jgi:hypothetical protein
LTVPEPSARSAAERRLEQIHDSEDGPVTPADVRENELELERAYAGALADHPLLSFTEAEVLEICGYDIDELRAAAAEFYPEQLGHLAD